MAFLPPTLLFDPVVAATHDYGLDPVEAETLTAARRVGADGSSAAALRRQASALLVIAGAELAASLDNSDDFYSQIFAPGSNRLAAAMKLLEEELGDIQSFDTDSEGTIASSQYLVADCWQKLTVALGANAALSGDGLTGAALWAERSSAAHLLAQRAWCIEAMTELAETRGLPDARRHGAATVTQVREILDICGLKISSARFDRSAARSARPTDRTYD
tara:strand:+ start:8898 stop:9554 length:657 start_codon:yes stop_codon:yes gene_type:complete